MCFYFPDCFIYAGDNEEWLHWHKFICVAEEILAEKTAKNATVATSPDEGDENTEGSEVQPGDTEEKMEGIQTEDTDTNEKSEENGMEDTTEVKGTKVTTDFTGSNVTTEVTEWEYGCHWSHWQWQQECQVVDHDRRWHLEKELLFYEILLLITTCLCSITSNSGDRHWCDSWTQQTKLMCHCGQTEMSAVKRVVIRVLVNIYT